MLDAKDAIYNKVKACMEDQQCYLDPTMTLAKLSRIAGTNTSYLSSVINQRCGCSFREMLNRYRVELAKREILKAGESSFEIGSRCGFSSRSSYYSVFQKVTGVSPYQYLKSRVRKA